MNSQKKKKTKKFFAELNKRSIEAKDKSNFISLRYL
jgi:hypothetical protein